MAEAYIIDAVRTPMGRKKGSLAGLHPADLAAHPIRELIARSGIDANAVDDCVWGCCDTIGPQAGDIGRTAWLVAGLPQHVPGTTVDRQCGSSQQAVHFAAQGVMSGTQDLVVAGGSQAMNAIPISAAMFAGQPYGFDSPFIGSKGWNARYGTEEVNQIKSAEMIAGKWQISREAMEAFATESHRRAQAAVDYLLPFTEEFWSTSALEAEALDQGTGVDVPALRAAWNQTVDEALLEATLTRPADTKRYVPEGKRGVHSEHLGYLLGEMQSLARQHPGAIW